MQRRGAVTASSRWAITRTQHPPDMLTEAEETELRRAYFGDQSEDDDTLGRSLTKGRTLSTRRRKLRGSET
jgi:hypothetical protein